MKILISILLLFVSSFSYVGPTHEKIMKNMPIIFTNMGQSKNGYLLDIYINELSKGAVSPDFDYSNYKIPDKFVPLELKSISETSFIKWEHTLPDDVPKEIENVLSLCATNILHIKFQYANGTIVDWMNIAIKKWNVGERDSAFWYLGRTCHLIQDITVPMHCTIKGNLIEIWNSLNNKAPNQETFEWFADSTYVMCNVQECYKIPIYSLTGIINEIAQDSRSRMYLCDGIGFNFWLLKYFFPSFYENKELAVKLSLQEADKNTVKLICYFFEQVNY